MANANLLEEEEDDVLIRETSHGYKLRPKVRIAVVSVADDGLMRTNNK